jgi:rhodanese-related sulfurtransferase
MNPWLLSGLILVGFTAILSILFILQLVPTPAGLLPFEFVLIQKHISYDYIIDVRSISDFNKGHYPTAIHIDLSDIGTKLPEQIPKLRASIFFYCDDNRCSYRAAHHAQELGYRNVGYLVDGTYTDMQNLPPIL